MDQDHREEQLARLILSRLPGFAGGRYRQLRERFQSCRAALQAPPGRLQGILTEAAIGELAGISSPSHHLRLGAEQDWQWLQAESVAMLSPEDEDYPTLLKTLRPAPPLLFVRGSVDNLALPQLAIVGSRRPTPAGRDNAFHFARELARSGFTITSGLALGVDGAAHAGALAGGGKTIAILGTGIDRLYPRRHLKLAEQILAEGGTLVSEFPLGSGPMAEHFPRRNRIISGLSLGVLVVEAAVKSGSLITAHYAMQQGREVFAIPGSIHNPLSRGCHALLREGATLVEEVADLREPLQGMLALKWSELPSIAEDSAGGPAPSSQEQRVLEALGHDETPLDLVIARCGLDTGEVLSLLMQLEVAGLVEQGDRGYQRRDHSQEKRRASSAAKA